MTSHWHGTDAPSNLNGTAIDDDEELSGHAEDSVHRRLRANSSIMQLKKILGM